MATSTYTSQEYGAFSEKALSRKVGSQPFNRDDIFLAFGKLGKSDRIHRDGQELSGTGALVFEGEVLEFSNWH